jgi:hypothetical protein
MSKQKSKRDHKARSQARSKNLAKQQPQPAAELSTEKSAEPAADAAIADGDHAEGKTPAVPATGAQQPSDWPGMSRKGKGKGKGKNQFDHTRGAGKAPGKRFWRM